MLDITFSGDGKLSSLTVEKVERTANSKPAWWTIGNSTVQQNGSWAYTLNNTLSDYPKLSNVIHAVFLTAVKQDVAPFILYRRFT